MTEIHPPTPTTVVALTHDGVVVDGVEYRLSITQLVLVHLLSLHAGHFVSVERLAESMGTTRQVVACHISRTRTRVPALAIESRKGFGYRLLNKVDSPVCPACGRAR